MENAQLLGTHITSQKTVPNLLRGLVWGMMGGFAGTLVMDLTLMGILAAFGSPVLSCFAIVGNTIASFFSLQNVDAIQAILLGVVTHYIVGPAMGVTFGLVVTRVKVLRVSSLKKSTLLGILFVEIMSQPLLATAPILLQMTTTGTLQWYGGSFVMHMIAGAVMGAVLGCGLKMGKPRKL